MSLSETEEATIRLLALFANLPNWVPSSFNRMSAPSASRIISPDESIVTSVPSLVIVSNAMEPTLVMLLSLKEVAPKLTDPVDVRLDEPISIFPNPEDIAPAPRVPTEVI